MSLTNSNLTLHRDGLLTAVRDKPPVKVASYKFDRLAQMDIMFDVLVWAGMDAAVNQECPFHDSVKKRSFYVYRRANGVWGWKCSAEGKCGLYGNVVELYYGLVERSVYKPDWWSRKYAAGDLLVRLQAGEIPHTLESTATVCNYALLSHSKDQLLHYLHSVQRERGGNSCK